jgi:hypothetical protein
VGRRGARSSATTRSHDVPPRRRGHDCVDRAAS